MERFNAILPLLLAICLVIAEAVVPIVLILIISFLIWRFTQPKWINSVFASLVYKKNPPVNLIFGQVAKVAEEKGKKIEKILWWFAFVLCIGVILNSLLPYTPYQNQTIKLFFNEELPRMCLHLGMIFISFGILLSILYPLFFVKEMKKYKVSNRGMEIYLLSKYLENILYILTGVALIIGGLYLWFYFLGELLPLFTHFESQFTSFSSLKGTFEEIVTVLKVIFVGFREQLRNWVIVGFLIILVSFAVPYMWFKGKSFTIGFLIIFLVSISLTYFVSVLIRKFVGSEVTAIFIIVWMSCGLITYVVFHLIKNISLAGVTICLRCQAENSADSKYCKQCGNELIVSPKE